MKFEEVVARIGTITDIRRIASAHGVDHGPLKDGEPREALVKTKYQYLLQLNGSAAADEACAGVDQASSRPPTPNRLRDSHTPTYAADTVSAHKEARGGPRPRAIEAPRPPS